MASAMAVRRGLQPQAMKILEFAPEVLDRVVDPDGMGFEEPAQFVTRWEARKTAVL